MKKYLIFLISALFCMTQNTWAQDDDVYFIPSKKEKKQEQPKNFTSEYTPIEDEYSYDNWADQRSNNGRDVDEYNRRKSPAQDQSEELTDYDMERSANGDCTSRIIRFHSPSVGVYVSSPYYSDYIDVWLDPWYYDPWYFGSSYWGWNGWYHSAYYWHHSYWYDPWYNPWGPCYGYGWYYPYYGHHHHYRPVPSGAHYGPHGGYVYYSHRNSSSGGHRYTGQNRYGNHYNNGRPSRDFGGNNYNNGRPSRNFGSHNNNSGRPSRNFGNSSSNRPSRETRTEQSRPSRSFGHSQQERPSSPSRSFDRPSRSFNSGFSGGSRNFGSGHHSRGGRR